MKSRNAETPKSKLKIQRGGIRCGERRSQKVKRKETVASLQSTVILFQAIPSKFSHVSLSVSICVICGPNSSLRTLRLRLTAHRSHRLTWMMSSNLRAWLCIHATVSKETLKSDGLALRRGFQVGEDVGWEVVVCWQFEGRWCQGVCWPAWRVVGAWSGARDKNIVRTMMISSRQRKYDGATTTQISMRRPAVPRVGNAARKDWGRSLRSKDQITTAIAARGIAMTSVSKTAMNGAVLACESGMRMRVATANPAPHSPNVTGGLLFRGAVSCREFSGALMSIHPWDLRATAV